jgi:hypothetical protein
MIVDMKANGEESADGRVISVASISGYWSNDGVRYQLVRRWEGTTSPSDSLLPVAP